MPEYMDIVDENDKVIGRADREEIMRRKLIHRGSNVFLFNSRHELFVHKRVPPKFAFPDYYDLLISKGVRLGETYEQAAKRGLEEEVGVTGVKLTPLFKLRFHSDEDNCFLQIFSCVYDGKVTPDKKEMELGRFVTIKTAQEMIKKEKFCPGSVQALEKYLKEKK